jgi:2-amino-4-hydroxy-6-hydroxymethyldihydropteridine diphosphokinase
VRPTNAHKAFIAFGGNTGDTKKYIARAIDALTAFGKVEKVSPLFRTKPVGYARQNDFINGALLLKTALGPGELLAALKETEIKTGRVPTFKNGPREIDLDIIFYDDIILNEPGLTIPHAAMHTREFVLLPLSFIAPGYTHPKLKQTVSALLKGLLKLKPAAQTADISNNILS